MRSTAPLDGRSGLSAVGLIIVIVVVLAAMGTGLVVAISATKDAESEETATTETKAAGPYAYIPFGPAIVNLNEGKLTRYIRVTLSLKVPEEYRQEALETLTGDKKALFMDWLIEYLCDLSLDDVKGAPALRALRREILVGFQSIFSELGDVKLEAVLVEEFTVQ